MQCTAIQDRQIQARGGESNNMELALPLRCILKRRIEDRKFSVQDRFLIDKG